MLTDFPIFGGYNKRENIDFDAEDLCNLFLIGDSKGKKRYAFLPTPGLSQKLTFGGTDGVTRQLYVSDSDLSKLYSVVGTKVYQINTVNNPTNIGTLSTVNTPVSISSNNGNQVIFVDGAKGWIFNSITNAFTQITDAGFPAQPTNIAFLDGFFVAPNAANNEFNISALNNGLSWDVLDFAKIQTYGGSNVGVGVVNERLFFFKTDSTEVWYNQGAADFPFRPDKNLIFNFGCLAAASIVSDYGYLFWLARDRSGCGSVMMTSGQTPNKISNESIDNLIASFTDPTDVRCYLYKDMGHILYVMNFNTDDYTLVYDVTMQNWHRMECQPNTVVNPYCTLGQIRHWSNCAAYFNNQTLVGSYKEPIIYVMNRSYAKNDTETITRTRITSHFFDPDGYRMMQINRIQLDMEAGIGESTGLDVFDDPNDDPIVNPMVWLSLSRDGGNRYGNAVPVSIGKIGQKRQRVIWRKKGIARDIVAKFVIYSPVKPIAILGASIDYQVLSK